MKFLVWWTGADGGSVDIGPLSLGNAIESALDLMARGKLLYITDDTGERLTLEAAQQLKAAADAQRSRRETPRS